MTHTKWFSNNYVWLRAWIDKALPYGDICIGTKQMQIIKTVCKSRLRITCDPDGRVIDASYFSPKMLEHTKEEHIRGILQSAIFGRHL